jgi:hypothetical protein
MRDDSQLYDLHAEVDGASRPSRLGGAVAALAALALLAGAVTWTYRLGVRDPSQVPVIRAVEGPARIRPEDPGGARFEHQGRAVYGALDGADDAPAAPAFAPPPEALAEEDVSPAARAAEAPPPAVPSGAPAEAPAETLAGTPAPAAAAPSLAAEVDRLVAEAIGVAAAAGAAPSVVAPPPRPGAGAARAAAPAGAAAVTAAPAAPVETAALGDAHVQLGAYLSDADARRMWEAIARRSGGLLAGRAPVVAPLQGTNRTLHRLWVGPFPSTDQARAFCETLRGAGEECLVTGPS